MTAFLITERRAPTPASSNWRRQIPPAVRDLLEAIEVVWHLDFDDPAWNRPARIVVPVKYQEARRGQHADE